MTLNILKGYEETLSKCMFNNEVIINFITNNNDDLEFKTDVINNLKKNIAFWSQYWTPEKEIMLFHGNENDLEWMKDKLTTLNMVDGLNMKNINSYSNVGGGGIVGEKLDVPLFWQIIGSEIPDFELKNVGLAKLSGHLYAHIAQPGLLNSVANNHVKITSMPSWYVEGQSDYHTVCLLGDDFIKNREKFLTTAYVPDGYKEKIKSASKDNWYKILLNDGNFETIPVTYEYWSGFLVYENLVINFGVDKVIDLIIDFADTKDFRKSMGNILDLNYKDFYVEMSDLLYNSAKNVVI